MKFIKTEHWSSCDMKCGRKRTKPKAYKVFSIDHYLGTVEQFQDTSHRKAGRLITRTSYSIGWRAVPNGTGTFDTDSRLFRSRQDAADYLLAKYMTNKAEAL